MAILLAALCAVTYGLADYCGGRASRSVASTIVTLLGQATSLVLVVGGVLLIGTPIASAHDLWWGAAGGAAGGLRTDRLLPRPVQRCDDCRRTDDRDRQRRRCR